MTVTDSPAVARAIETTDKVLSHLHPEGSFEVADHPVPSGREVIWRFTPMRRLRDPHQQVLVLGTDALRPGRPVGGAPVQHAFNQFHRGAA